MPTAPLEGCCPRCVAASCRAHVCHVAQPHNSMHARSHFTSCPLGAGTNKNIKKRWCLPWSSEAHLKAQGMRDGMISRHRCALKYDARTPVENLRTTRSRSPWEHEEEKDCSHSQPPPPDPRCPGGQGGRGHGPFATLALLLVSSELRRRRAEQFGRGEAGREAPGPEQKALWHESRRQG